MKNTIFLMVCTFLSFGIYAQNVIGAWESYHNSEKGEKLRSVVIFSDGYQAITTYDFITGKFMNTNGGAWRLKGDTMTEKVKFDSNNPERAGTEVSFKVHITDSVLEIVDHGIKFKRIDYGEPGELKGSWLMSGRIVDGKTQQRDINIPRKTMKILSGTRFQWIAYNTETKQFMGTGGGTYTTIDGVYTENIEFFSRDDSKAGVSLKFDYSLIDGKWNHTGFSSKGEPLNEIWSVRQ